MVFDFWFFYFYVASKNKVCTFFFLFFYWEIAISAAFSSESNHLLNHQQSKSFTNSSLHQPLSNMNDSFLQNRTYLFFFFFLQYIIDTLSRISTASPTRFIENYCSIKKRSFAYVREVQSHIISTLKKKT